MIGVSISNTSEEPIYLQLFQQIRSKILNGTLETRFNLPPIRTAAKELRISIITVKRGWEELERAGLIYTVVGKGCFVADLPNKDLIFYRKLGATTEEIIEPVKKLS